VLAGIPAAFNALRPMHPGVAGGSDGAGRWRSGGAAARRAGLRGGALQPAERCVPGANGCGVVAVFGAAGWLRNLSEARFHGWRAENC